MWVVRAAGGARGGARCLSAGNSRCGHCTTRQSARRPPVLAPSAARRVPPPGAARHAIATDLPPALALLTHAAKCLLDYTLQGQVASAGPGCLWKVYLARAKKEGAWGPQHLGSARSRAGSSRATAAWPVAGPAGRCRSSLRAPAAWPLAAAWL